MSKCNHATEYPVKYPSGSIYCQTCGRKLADTTFVGIEPEIIPVIRSSWTRDALTKALDKRAKPVYLNLDKLTSGTDLAATNHKPPLNQANPPKEEGSQ